MINSNAEENKYILYFTRVHDYLISDNSLFRHFYTLFATKVNTI